MSHDSVARNAERPASIAPTARAAVQRRVVGGDHAAQERALAPPTDGSRRGGGAPAGAQLDRIQSAFGHDVQRQQAPTRRAEAPPTQGAANTGGEAAPTVGAEAAAVDGPEARAATHSVAWQALAPEARAQIEQLITAGNHTGALQALAQAAGIAELGRITFEVTNQLGVVAGGPPVVPHQGEDGVTIGYVPVGGSAVGDIRAIVQLSPSLFSGRLPIAQRVAIIHNVLMHEVTHARQFFAGPLPTERRRVGNMEFIGEHDTARHVALDEIDATCAELENARATGIAQLQTIRTSIGYVWQHFNRAFRGASPPGNAVAERVLGAILAGRAALVEYITSPAFRNDPVPYRAGAHQYLFPAVNPYVPSAFAPFVNAGLLANARGAWAREAHLAGPAPE